MWPSIFLKSLFIANYSIPTRVKSKSPVGDRSALPPVLAVRISCRARSELACVHLHRIASVHDQTFSPCGAIEPAEHILQSFPYKASRIADRLYSLRKTARISASYTHITFTIGSHDLVCECFDSVSNYLHQIRQD